MSSPIQRRDCLLIFAAALVLFSLGHGPEFIRFQTRFGLFAQEMFRNGPTFFPTAYQEPFPDYPATSTFLTYLVSLVAGGVTPWTGIFPTALASALILVVTYRIGSLRSREWGLYGVLFAGLTYPFVSLSRSISLDQFTSLAAVLSFYLVYSASIQGRHRRLWWLPVVFVAGFAFRGPIGLVVPTGVVCGYYLYVREYKRFWLAGLAGGTMLAVCSAALLGAAYWEGGDAFVKRVIDFQVAGRLGTKNSPAYYWVGGFYAYALSYPLAALVLLSKFKSIRRRAQPDHELLGSLGVWVLVVLVGMSIPGTKKMRYLLPIVPALSLLAAYLMIDPPPNGVLASARRLFLGFCRYAVYVPAVVGWAAWPWAARFFPAPALYYSIAVGVLSLVALLALIYQINFRRHPARPLLEMSGMILVLAATEVCLVAPVNQALQKTRPFVETVEALLERQPRALVFYQIGLDQEATKFMVNARKPYKPTSVYRPVDVLNHPENAFFIAEERDFNRLPPQVAARAQVLLRGRIGTRECLLFEVRPASASSPDA